MIYRSLCGKDTSQAPRCHFRTPLQIKSIDKVNLCIPALRFESALTDVVVAGRAGEGKVVGHQGLKLTLVLFLPCLIPPAGQFLRMSCSAPYLRAPVPLPGAPPLQPVRKLPIRAPSAVILRSLSCPSAFSSSWVSGFWGRAIESATPNHFALRRRFETVAEIPDRRGGAERGDGWNSSSMYRRR